MRLIFQRPVPTFLLVQNWSPCQPVRNSNRGSDDHNEDQPEIDYAPLSLPADE